MILKLLMVATLRYLSLKVDRVTRNKGLQQHSKFVSGLVSSLQLQLLILFIQAMHEEGRLVLDIEQRLQIDLEIAVLVYDLVLKQILMRLLCVLLQHLDVQRIDHGSVHLLKQVPTLVVVVVESKDLFNFSDLLFGHFELFSNFFLLTSLLLKNLVSRCHWVRVFFLLGFGLPFGLNDFVS